MASLPKAAITAKTVDAQLSLDKLERMTIETLQKAVMSRIGQIAKLVRYILDRIRAPYAIDGVAEYRQRQLSLKNSDVIRIAPPGPARDADAWQAVDGTALGLHVVAGGALALDADWVQVLQATPPDLGR
jgi:hypothetical protein